MKYNLQQKINPEKKGANKFLITKAKISKVRTSYIMRRDQSVRGAHTDLEKKCTDQIFADIYWRMSPMCLAADLIWTQVYFSTPVPN